MLLGSHSTYLHTPKCQHSCIEIVEALRLTSSAYGDHRHDNYVPILSNFSSE